MSTQGITEEKYVTRRTIICSNSTSELVVTLLVFLASAGFGAGTGRLFDESKGVFALFTTVFLGAGFVGVTAPPLFAAAVKAAAVARTLVVTMGLLEVNDGLPVGVAVRDRVVLVDEGAESVGVAAPLRKDVLVALPFIAIDVWECCEWRMRDHCTARFIRAVKSRGRALVY